MKPKMVYFNTAVLYLLNCLILCKGAGAMLQHDFEKYNKMYEAKSQDEAGAFSPLDQENQMHKTNSRRQGNMWLCYILYKGQVSCGFSRPITENYEASSKQDVHGSKMSKGKFLRNKNYDSSGRNYYNKMGKRIKSEFPLIYRHYDINSRGSGDAKTDNLHHYNYSGSVQDIKCSDHACNLKPARDKANDELSAGNYQAKIHSTIGMADSVKSESIIETRVPRQATGESGSRISKNINDTELHREDVQSESGINDKNKSNKTGSDQVKGKYTTDNNVTLDKHKNMTGTGKNLSEIFGEETDITPSKEDTHNIDKILTKLKKKIWEFYNRNESSEAEEITIHEFKEVALDILRKVVDRDNEHLSKRRKEATENIFRKWLDENIVMRKKEHKEKHGDYMDKQTIEPAVAELAWYNLPKHKKASFVNDKQDLDFKKWSDLPVQNQEQFSKWLESEVANRNSSTLDEKNGKHEENRKTDKMIQGYEMAELIQRNESEICKGNRSDNGKEEMTLGRSIIFANNVTSDKGQGMVEGVLNNVEMKGKNARKECRIRGDYIMAMNELPDWAKQYIKERCTNGMY